LGLVGERLKHERLLIESSRRGSTLLAAAALRDAESIRCRPNGDASRRSEGRDTLGASRSPSLEARLRAGLRAFSRALDVRYAASANLYSEEEPSC
jgi:hypothetical protein